MAQDAERVCDILPTGEHPQCSDARMQHVEWYLAGHSGLAGGAGHTSSGNIACSRRRLIYLSTAAIVPSRSTGAAAAASMTSPSVTAAAWNERNSAASSMLCRARRSADALSGVSRSVNGIAPPAVIVRIYGIVA